MGDPDDTSRILDYGLGNSEVLFTHICQERLFDFEEEDADGAA